MRCPAVSEEGAAGWDAAANGVHQQIGSTLGSICISYLQAWKRELSARR